MRREGCGLCDDVDARRSPYGLIQRPHVGGERVAREGDGRRRIHGWLRRSVDRAAAPRSRVNGEHGDTSIRNTRNDKLNVELSGPREKGCVVESVQRSETSWPPTWIPSTASAFPPFTCTSPALDRKVSTADIQMSEIYLSTCKTQGDMVFRV